MGEQRLENYLSMPEHDLTIYEDETTISYISFPIYQVNTIDTMLFCVDTGDLITASETRLSKISSVIPDVDLFQ